MKLNILAIHQKLKAQGITISSILAQNYSFLDAENNYYQFEGDYLINKPLSPETQLIIRQVIQDELDNPTGNYNPGNFLLQMSQSASYRTWRNQIPSNDYADFLLAINRAAESNFWGNAQLFYDGLKAQYPSSTESVTEWAAIAKSNGISLNF